MLCKHAKKFIRYYFNSEVLIDWGDHVPEWLECRACSPRNRIHGSEWDEEVERIENTGLKRVRVK